MISILKRTFDAWRGSGRYAVTVPPMDGALRPNQAIEEARTLLEIAAPDNLVHDGSRQLFSSGETVYALATDGMASRAQPFVTLDRAVSALAVHPGGSMAIGLDDGRILVRGGHHDGKVVRQLGDRPIICPAALAFADANTLLIALGSQKNAPERWKYDLMECRATGSVWKLELGSGQATCLADRLAYPYGLLPGRDATVIVSESWRSQLIRVRTGHRPEVELTDIPGYPARLASAHGGGAWLSVFAPRSQLVEFVLRDTDYRQQMMKEIEPQFWIAPSLAATQSLLEPMQLGGLKQLGILKPWAPTRSYGLIIRLDDASEPQASFHSRADGRRHGITSCIEIDQRLLATSKGGDAILAMPLVDAHGANR